MKRIFSMLLVLTLLLSCVAVVRPPAHAASKAGSTRTIAIVFDNSGSMYQKERMEWCRATYAMEVFASMLNAGDTLLIYPMHPITVGGQQFTMDSPMQVTDSSQASLIREIFTPEAEGTPIESVDRAVEGLKAAGGDKKYLIVLTDGAEFDLEGKVMGESETRRQLDARFEANAGNGMTLMYLGIGREVTMPRTEESDVFVKRHAKDSEDVLSSLTEMCNLIFGRDTLPDNHLNGNTIDFDISMKKLIVFVQGENVADLQVVGPNGPVGSMLSSASTHYGTAGCGNYTSVPDTSLQGMMVTYADCPAGTYTVEYSGTASSVEVYYEPDADLDFVFTDLDGNTVDNLALYEGEYKVSYGMKDARTGELIDSDLLGNPVYKGSYYINDSDEDIDEEGASGFRQVSLKIGDLFKADLTVTYLSGYTITKNSTDFGWPEFGITISARPAGEFKMEISGGQGNYSLQKLEEGESYIAKIFYEGKQLTGEELEKVDLRWDPASSNALLKNHPQGDYLEIRLFYKDQNDPQSTVCGECTVDITATYTPPGTAEASAQDSLTYNIVDDFSPLQMELQAPQDYFVISEMEDGMPLEVKLTLNGSLLTPEEFAQVTLDVDCGGLEYELIPKEDKSAYEIKLLPTDNIQEGDYKISVTATHTDQIGRTSQAEDAVKITVSTLPLIIKILIFLALLLLLALIIFLIARIRVLPKHNGSKSGSTMYVDGEDVTTNTQFKVKIDKGSLQATARYGGKTFGTVMSVEPGKESYLCKPKKNRSALVKPTSVKRSGVQAQEITVVNTKFVLDENGKMVPAIPNAKPFLLKNGNYIKIIGETDMSGNHVSYTASIKMNFNKKK